MATQKIEVRMPLFDRLVDRDPRLRHELRPMRTLDRRGLRESVRRELEQLLNTRCPFPAHRLPLPERSVIDYGIPDFSSYSARNFDDRRRLAEILAHTIAAFEPRLIDVRVELEQVPGDDLALRGIIEARMLTDSVPEPVSFETSLEMRDGKVEVHAGTR
ncbi:MAG: type VI secretion system baseplate subunit TssE [Acidobacteriota bacterium]